MSNTTFGRAEPDTAPTVEREVEIGTDDPNNIEIQPLPVHASQWRVCDRRLPGFRGAVEEQGHETRRAAGVAGAGADAYVPLIRDWLEELPPRPWDDKWRES